MDFGPPEWPPHLSPDAEFNFSALLDKRTALSAARALENQAAAREYTMPNTTDFLQFRSGSSSESIYSSTSTPTESTSRRSSLYSIDFSNLVLPPVPSLLPRPRPSLRPSLPPQPRPSSSLPQPQPRSPQVPRRTKTGKILHGPPPPEHNYYPIWNSVQKYINLVTLCCTLISTDFHKTFYQKNVMDPVVRAFLQRAASDAITIIHSVHVGDRKKLEAIPNNDTAFFAPFIREATKYTTKTLRSFQIDNIKLIEIGYGIRRLDNRTSSNFPLIALDAMNQIIRASELENNRYLHFTNWSNEQSQSVFALGNPVIADLIDKNYYIGPWAIARDMCKVEKEYPSIRAIAPQLFVWDKELPETAFWWSTMAAYGVLYSWEDGTPSRPKYAPNSPELVNDLQNEYEGDYFKQYRSSLASKFFSEAGLDSPQDFSESDFDGDKFC